MNVNWKFSLLGAVFFVLHFSGLLLAQNPNFSFNYLSSLDGLSNNSVTAVLEDSRGFLWMATRDGLNRFNGYSFKQFKWNVDDNNTLPDNHILCLAEDKSDNLWVGTNQSGMARYNVVEERFHRYYPIENDVTSIPGKFIRKIKVDSKNGVWIGTDKGLAKYNPDSENFRRFSFPQNDGRREGTADVRDILQTSDNEIVVQCNLGLFKVNLTTNILTKFEFPQLPFNPELFKQEIPLLFDRSDNIWLGSLNGLIKYNIITHQFKHYRHSETDTKSISSNHFSSVIQDKKGNIWIGTKDGGVNLYNSRTDNFTVLKVAKNKRKGLSCNGINQIYEDSHRNLWFSTQEAGITYVNVSNSYFEYFDNDPFDDRSISHNIINTFYEDIGGMIWVCPDDGILNKMVSPNEFVKYKLKAEYEFPSILGVVPNGENKFLITGWGVGLYEFDKLNNSFKDLMKGIEINGKPLFRNIKGIGTDLKGNVWLASHHVGGLIVYSPAENKFYNEANPGPFDPDLMKVPYSVSMIQDHKKRIWIVSYAGIFMFDGHFHAYHNRPDNRSTLGSDYAYTLFEDKSGQLWVGNSSGLEKIIENKDSISFERLNTSYPFPNNIKGILQDNRGYLWLSSNSELTQFHPETKQIRHYRINKDLPNPEFFERSCLRASNGEMYFGGTSGFFRFHPDSIAKNITVEKVYFTDFLLFNKSEKVNSPNSPLKKSIFETTKIELDYDQSVIGFEYAALNFNPYKTVEYAYKMEGFDKEWYYAGEKRSVTYTNLPNGEYIFKVKLVDGTEISDAPGAEVKLIIHPPLWRTNLAYVLYIILIIGMLYLFRLAVLNREKLKNELQREKLNMENIREANFMKMRFFVNVSHEIRTPLTLIKAPLERLMQSEALLADKESKYHLDLIEKNSDRLLKMVNQLMDYKKLEDGKLVLETSHEDIILFCKNTWAAFSTLANQKKITYTFHSQLDTKKMAFDTEKLDKILSNLLTNAFKFTQEFGQVSVIISSRISKDKPEMIEIAVKDNGIGIKEKDLGQIFDRFYSSTYMKDAKIEGTGIGLTIAKELAELHKGDILVRSKYGEGAEFIIQLPIIKHESTIQNNEVQGVDFVINTVYESSIHEIDAKIDPEVEENKPTILVVEDDKGLREFIKCVLEPNYKIILAVNGEEGLRKASLEIPNLVLSDVMMPVMDGYELCKTIKTDERTSHLPVILLTARHSQEHQLEGFDAGADDYILKPFSVAILRSRVQNLLNNRNKIIEKFKTGKSLYFEPEAVDNKDTKFIQSIIDLVLENISDENINADYIAKKLLISRSRVYLKIEAMTGQTVNEFIRNIRLKKSLRLLEQKNMTVTEVAHAVGFSSQSYYTRSFKKLYGFAPKEAI
jgi:signal transduction histidine kinase/ligand-binding sensor domain-containing protein/DNA-binding response OmpR family regulator